MVSAPSIAISPPQTWRRWLPRLRALGIGIEAWLEAERDQLPLWLPVGLGAGIAAWFGLPDDLHWRLFLLLSGAGALFCFAIGIRGRLVRAAGWMLLVAALGCALSWARDREVAGPVLSGTQVTTLKARVLDVSPLPAREAVRLLLAPEGQPALPPRLRVNMDEDQAPGGLAPGARLSLRARLLPPPPAALPGAYDFARIAWFQRIGATGKVLGQPRVIAPAPPPNGFIAWLDTARLHLTRHIEAALPGNAGGTAAAFVTGDVGAIDLATADDFRRSGLAHLLSISGLHITAVVAATMLLTLRLLALSSFLALRLPLLLIAAAAGALAGIGYTLLSGAEVPTLRSCVAALLVLAGMALGREAMTLRLVAAGAVVVLLFRPEALVGPSFQLSFAAVTAIIAFHEHPKIRAWALKRDEPLGGRIWRELTVLLATGVLVELALVPIAAYHFHRAGLYGAFANIVAIPLSTFVIMPLEAASLLLDAVGLGGPSWWLTGKAIGLLLWLAQRVASLPGAAISIPSMPLPAFLLMVAGGLWIGLWRTRARRIGAIPLAIGAAWALLTPPPDLLITGDGKHLAVRTPEGALYLLRPRAHDYVRQQLGEGAGVQADALDLDTLPGARCSDDACVAVLARGGRTWHLLATRSAYHMNWQDFIRACRWADVAISDRRLPRACSPRWLKLDAPMLRQTGGVAITLASGAVRTVNGGDQHGWVRAQALRAPGAAGRRASWQTPSHH